MNVNFPELIVVFCIALLVLGPERLPDVAKKLGQKLGRPFREFQAAMNPDPMNAVTDVNMRTRDTLSASPVQSELVDAAFCNNRKKE